MPGKVHTNTNKHTRVPIASTLTRGRVWNGVQWLERRVIDAGMRSRGREGGRGGGGIGRRGSAENGRVRDSEAQRINLPVRLAQVGPRPGRRVWTALPLMPSGRVAALYQPLRAHGQLWVNVPLAKRHHTGSCGHRTPHVTQVFQYSRGKTKKQDWCQEAWLSRKFRCNSRLRCSEVKGAGGRVRYSRFIERTNTDHSDILIFSLHNEWRVLKYLFFSSRNSGKNF